MDHQVKRLEGFKHVYYVDGTFLPHCPSVAREKGGWYCRDPLTGDVYRRDPMILLEEP